MAPTATLDPPVPVPVTDAELAESYFEDLKLTSVDAAFPSAISDEIAAAWLKEAAAGGRGAGFLETDAGQARLDLAKIRVSSLFVRYRRQLNDVHVRGLTPLVPDTSAYESIRARLIETTGSVPRGRPWVLTEDHPEALVAHSRFRMKTNISLAIKFHGASLVAAGAATWDDIEERGCAQVRADVAEMRALDAARQIGKGPVTPPPVPQTPRLALNLPTPVIPPRRRPRK